MRPRTRVASRSRPVIEQPARRGARTCCSPHDFYSSCASPAPCTQTYQTAMKVRGSGSRVCAGSERVQSLQLLGAITLRRQRIRLSDLGTVSHIRYPELGIHPVAPTVHLDPRAFTVPGKGPLLVS